MPRLIAFLRAINVGGHNVAMEKLRGLFESLGCTEVETFIASGNLIFSSPNKNLRALEGKIERHLGRSLGYAVDTFIRTPSEVAAAALHQPFHDSKVESAASFNVGFLANPLEPAAEKALMALKTEIDDFHVHGREVYWLCQVGQSESTFSNARFERTLKVRATWRGMKTVARLAAKYASPPKPGSG